MAMRILWPNIPAEFGQIARDANGPGFEAAVRAAFADVTDGRWANPETIVGASPPPSAKSCASPGASRSWSPAMTTSTGKSLSHESDGSGT